MIFGSIRRWRAQKLAERGYTRLAEGEHEEALRISEKMAPLRYSASFEIGARALVGMKKPGEAISLVERGLVEAPDAWPLWQLLGSLRSDFGDYEGAAAAYAEGVKRAPDGEHSIRINQAILATRVGDYEEARSILASVEPSTPTEAAVIARVESRSYLGQEDPRTAAEVADRALQRLTREDVDCAELAELQNALGRALFESGAAAPEIRKCVFGALDLDPANPGALALLRSSQGLSAPDALRFRLTIHGVCSEDAASRGDGQGYFVGYDVVASSPQEALGFAVVIDSRGSDAETSLEECEELGPEPGALKGVYGFTGRAYYDE